MSVICGLGLAALVGVLFWGDVRIPSGSRLPEYVALALLCFVGEYWPIRVGRGTGSGGAISISTPFIFALLLSFGLGLAAVTLVVASMLADALRRRPLIRNLFNACQYTLSLVGCDLALRLLAGGHDILGDAVRVGSDLGLILVAGFVFFMLNTLFPSIALALDQGMAPFKILRRDLAYHVATAGILTAVAPVVVVAANYSILLLPILLLPALAVHWSASISLESEHQSLHDSLTGLPNRALFHIRVEAALETQPRAAVMLVDLDRFKEVNDTLGHATGDRLLVLVGEALQRMLGDDATVARLGGDEFAILLPRIRSATDATSTAERMLELLNEPFVVDELALSVEGSIGVALYPEDGSDSGTLLRCADVAMYLAKEGRKGYERYSTVLDEHTKDRLALRGQLRDAMEQDQFVLHYQPKIDLQDGRVIGVEALVRWQHPQLGLLSPDRFIPLLERTVHLAAFTEHVIEKALRQSRLWRDEGYHVPVAVNVPPILINSTLLVDAVTDLIGAAGLGPANLELEITEGTLVSDPERAMMTLSRLHHMGIAVSIDDFGTGYSSLSYLQQLAVHAIKIDKSFVIGIDTDPGSRRIVESIVRLADDLGLVTIAEGVESDVALQMLRALGCRYGQGMHIAPPQPAAQLSHLLSADGTRVASLATDDAPRSRAGSA